MKKAKRLLALALLAIMASVSIPTALAAHSDTFGDGWAIQKMSSHSAAKTRAIQTICKYYNPNSLTVDGAFGKITDGAVKDFQFYTNCTQVDGEVGPETWGKMRSQLSGSTRIDGNGNASSTGAYYGFKVYQRNTAQHTSTYYFRRNVSTATRWDVYVASSGTWVFVN